MIKDYDNSRFYHSKQWKKVSTAYMMSRSYICERCGRPATICHHKKYLNGRNVNDPDISLSFDNLEALCQECHNQEHSRKMSLTRFDGAGNVVGVKQGSEERQFKADQNKIDQLLEKLTTQKARHGLREGSVEESPTTI